MFVIFDLGRYAITMQSLKALANAGARAVMINCYNLTSNNTSPLAVPVDYLSAAQKQTVAPFLYAGGLTPTAEHTAPGSQRADCYGIATRFHHADADMGHGVQRAERVHLNSLLHTLMTTIPKALTGETKPDFRVDVVDSIELPHSGHLTAPKA